MLLLLLMVVMMMIMIVMTLMILFIATCCSRQSSTYQYVDTFLVVCGRKFLTVMGKSQIKSNHDVNQMTTVPASIVYVRNVINVHLA